MATPGKAVEIVFSAQAASDGGTEGCVHTGTLIIRHLPIGLHLVLPQALPFSKGPVDKSWGYAVEPPRKKS